MSNSPKKACPGRNRRDFLLTAGAGLAGVGIGAGGVALSWAAFNKGLPLLRGSSTGSVAAAQSVKLGMPGEYPGRVIEVNHPGAVDDRNAIQKESVHEMMNRGMCALTGAELPAKPADEKMIARDAWRKFFERGDVVGIKVNPVGRKPLPGEGWRARDAVGAISNPEVVIEIVRGLKQVGIRPQDIIVFERYADEFRLAGYEAMMLERELDGVRWCAAASRYSDPQLDIEGFDAREDRGDRHVVGYDPDHFALMTGFCDPLASNNDDRRFRSHLSMVVARMVNKFITIPVLKDHRSAGVTLALKNLSHGMNNNVARSHLGSMARLDGASGPNQCNTFIPTAVNQPLIREKATLHILDGLIGVYEGGPGNWNKSWGTWQRKSLFFATDPVAMDMVGWPIIDAERKNRGLPPVEGTGISFHTTGAPPEQFDWRTPQHILLSGNAGLGICDPKKIDHRVVKCEV